MNGLPSELWVLVGLAIMLVALAPFILVPNRHAARLAVLPLMRIDPASLALSETASHFVVELDSDRTLVFWYGFTGMRSILLVEPSRRMSRVVPLATLVASPAAFVVGLMVKLNDSNWGWGALAAVAFLLCAGAMDLWVGHQLVARLARR